MKEKMTEIKSGEKSYFLVFNLNVMESIQEDYDTFEKWAKLLEESEPNIKALKKGFFYMMNEAIDILNEKNNTTEPFVTLKQVGRILTSLDQSSVVGKMQDLIIKSTADTEENSKNE